MLCNSPVYNDTGDVVLKCVTVPAGPCEGRRCCAEGRSSHGDDRNEDGGKQKTFPLVT